MKNLLLPFLLSFSCTNAAAEPQVLSVEQGVSAALGPGEVHQYRLDLPARQFVFGSALQSGVDVKLTVFGPSDQVIANFDGPVVGPEPFALDTEVAGSYRVEVTAKGAAAGRYTLNLHRSEPIASDPKLRLDQLLARFSGDDTPGAIVAIVDENQIQHYQAVGMANLTFGIGFSRDTVSNIGSVSKQFTAFAVAQLVEQGKVAFDDDIRDYFPELPEWQHVVTVRHLLNHTNGFRDYLNLLPMVGWRVMEGDYIDRDVLIATLQSQPHLQSAPGQAFSYNNTAYGLAALLVERVTGRSFSDWMTLNLFQPLDMRTTRVRTSTGQVIQNAADGYVYGSDAAYRQAADFGGGGEATIGPGAIYTTVNDMARWMRNFQHAKVGGRAVIDQLTTSRMGNPNYALGLVVKHHRGMRVYQHGGADAAHRAFMAWFPEMGSGVIAMSNNSSFDAQATAMQAFEAFFGDQMHAAPVVASSHNAGTDQGPGELDIPASVFDRHLGKYEFPHLPGVTIEIAREGDQIYIKQPGSQPMPVNRKTATSLFFPPQTTISFNLNDQGHAESFSWVGAQTLVAHRIAPWMPDSDALAEYVGSYFNQELLTGYEIQTTDRGLVLKHPRMDPITLHPKVTDAFSGQFPIVGVEFVRENGQVTGLKVSNTPANTLRFDRLVP